jgi:hypothetical protein
VSGQLHAPAALLPGKTPGTHWIGGWVGPRAGLDAVVRKIPSPYRDLKPRSPSYNAELSRLLKEGVSPVYVNSTQLFKHENTFNISVSNGTLTNSIHRA